MTTTYHALPAYLTATVYEVWRYDGRAWHRVTTMSDLKTARARAANYAPARAMVIEARRATVYDTGAAHA